MITVKQMAEGYVSQVEQQIRETQERYQRLITEMKGELDILTDHLNQCKQTLNENEERVILPFDGGEIVSTD